MKRYSILLAGLCMLCLTACMGGTGSQEDITITYGNSANMKSGGLVESDEEALYYVWEDNLYRMEAQSGETKILDTHGADSLCMTPRELFYGSYDEQGVRGIYKIEQGSAKRSLVYQTDFVSLYAAGKELFFLEQGNVCAVSKEGSEYRVLYEGDFEALTLDSGILYFKDSKTRAFYGKELTKEQTTLSEADILIADSGPFTPVVTEGWIYYDSGQWMKTYRTKTDGSETQERGLDGTKLLAQGVFSYADNMQTDWESGETTQWTDSASIRLAGFAGEKIIYEEYSYDPERLTSAVLIPQEVKLILHDKSQSAPDVVLQVRSQADKALNSETAKNCFLRLLEGRRTLLRNQAEGFFEALAQEESVNYLFLDVDGDRMEELFVRTAGYCYIFHASADGIYCWLAYPADEEAYVQPLTDGSLLYRTTYRMEGVVQESYDIYRIQTGGKAARVNTLQHLQLDTDALQLDGQTESHIQENTYFVQDTFAEEQEWEQAVQEMTALLIPTQDYETYSRNQGNVIN